MNFLRRIFDNTSDSPSRRRASRRAAHVSPSDSRRNMTERVIAEPSESEIEDEAFGLEN